jgi:hypothetical protein
MRINGQGRVAEMVEVSQVVIEVEVQVMVMSEVVVNEVQVAVTHHSLQITAADLELLK